MNEPLIVLFKEKFFHRKSIGGGVFFANSSTGYFSGKLFFERHSSGQTGSNDNGLEFVSCLRTEKKAVKQTDFEYYGWIRHRKLKIYKLIDILPVNRE